MEGVRKVAWAVKFRSADGSVTTVSYHRHETSEQAIRAYEEATGKSWAEHVRAGAELVQVEMVELKKLPSK